jgi:orotidine-5'-phosphate decarboxylase
VPVEKRIIVALDFNAAKIALNLVDSLDPKLCRLKIGKELYTACGPDLLKQIQSRGFEVFLDLKFHDIPNTVAKAVTVSGNMGVWMLNVHASGGQAMMEAAR